MSGADDHSPPGPTEPPAKQGAARRSGRLRWALAASMSLNLLLAGLIVGAAVRQAHWRGAPGESWRGAQAEGWRGAAPQTWSRDGNEEPRLRDGGERSNPRDRDAPSMRAHVRAALAARGPAFEARREGLRDAWRAVRDTAQAEPLDPARLDAALAGLRAAETALTAERHAAFAALAAGMSADQRARMLRAMASRFEQGRR